MGGHRPSPIVDHKPWLSDLPENTVSREQPELSFLHTNQIPETDSRMGILPMLDGSFSVTMTGHWKRNLDRESPHFEKQKELISNLVSNLLARMLTELYAGFSFTKYRQWQGYKRNHQEHRQFTLETFGVADSSLFNSADLDRTIELLSNHFPEFTKSYPVGIVGQPGAGKSHLLAALRDQFPNSVILPEKVNRSLTGAANICNFTNEDGERIYELPIAPYSFSSTDLTEYQSDSAQPTELEGLIAYAAINLSREFDLLKYYIYELATDGANLIAHSSIHQSVIYILASAGFEQIPKSILKLLSLLPAQPQSLLMIQPDTNEHTEWLNSANDPKRQQAMANQHNIESLLNDLLAYLQNSHIVNPQNREQIVSLVDENFSPANPELALFEQLSQYHTKMTYAGMLPEWPQQMIIEETSRLLTRMSAFPVETIRAQLEKHPSVRMLIHVGVRMLWSKIAIMVAKIAIESQFDSTADHMDFDLIDQIHKFTPVLETINANVVGNIPNPQELATFRKMVDGVRAGKLTTLQSQMEILIEGILPALDWFEANDLYSALSQPVEASKPELIEA